RVDLGELLVQEDVLLFHLPDAPLVIVPLRRSGRRRAVQVAGLVELVLEFRFARQEVGGPGAPQPLLLQDGVRRRVVRQGVKRRGDEDQKSEETADTTGRHSSTPFGRRSVGFLGLSLPSVTQRPASGHGVITGLWRPRPALSGVAGRWPR